MILLRIFKNNRLGGMAGMLLFIIGVFLCSYIHDFGGEGSSLVTQYRGMPFYQLIFGAIHTVPLVNHLTAMLLLILISILLVRIGIRDQLLEERSLMPGFFFMLFAAAIPEARQVSPALVGSVFYLLCFSIVFEVHNKKPDTYSIFSASLLLVLGSMFYLKLIWFIPLIWGSLRTMRPVTWRELFYPVVAYVLMALFLFTWYWGVMDHGEGFTQLVSQNLAFTGGLVPYHFNVYLFYGYLLLLVLVASIYMINRFQTRKTLIQKIYQVLFYMFVAGTLFFVFVARFDPSGLVFIAFPVSYVLSYYFHRRKNPWIHELALWILVGMVVYVQVMA